ncbi:CD1375 family protein [Paenibacillus alvei]|nr:CD1375 family protein [Paenibacillus alvei]
MAKIYCDLIRIGLRSIEQVPSTWRADVQKMLES